MKTRGFVLLGVLVGLFFVGFISVMSLPILTSSYANYRKINVRTEMNYLGESIYERLCAKDEYTRELIDQLGTQDEVDFLDLNDYHLKKFKVTLVTLDKCGNFIDVKILIQSNSDGGNIADVEFKGSILR